MADKPAPVATILGAETDAGEDPAAPQARASTVVGSEELAATRADGDPEAHSDPAGDLAEGASLGKYVVRRKLGAGAMGAVYLAFDPMIEREVAVKVLSPAVAARPNALRRFLTEARATGKLNHPGVVSIYDIGRQDVAGAAGELHYIVMEVLRGGSVLDRLGQSPKGLGWEEAVRITAEAADGLAAAHAADLIHRDIKPENLMLAEAPGGGPDVVKVVDFGLAKLLDAVDDPGEAATKVGQVMGTPQFMSPEQFAGQGIDHRTDVYSLGGTLHQLLTGDFPFGNPPTVVQLMYAHLESPPPDPRDSRPELPAGLTTVVARALAKSPDDRYPTAAEMAADLRSLLGGSADSPAADEGEAESYRPLGSAVIAEPSKMQAMMLRDALQKAGVDSVTVAGTAAEARAAGAVGLAVSSMHLPDGSGPALLSELAGGGAMLVLNSSDSSAADLLAAAGETASAALVSKKTKPEEVLRAVHAASFLELPSDPFGAAVDPLSLRVLMACEGGRVPEGAAAVVRAAGVLDISVSPLAGAADGAFDLVLAIRTAGRSAGDGASYAELLGTGGPEARCVAAVQIDDGRLTVRAVRRGGFTALCRCPFDERRLRRILQAARVS